MPFGIESSIALSYLTKKVILADLVSLEPSPCLLNTDNFARKRSNSFFRRSSSENPAALGTAMDSMLIKEVSKFGVFLGL